MNKEIESIARYYGFPHQANILIEETSELVKELCKYNRATTVVEKQKLYERIEEEIADVEIMLEQMRVFLGNDKIDAYKTAKIERQLERIEEEFKCQMN